jgi:hypothetical protein
LLLDRPLGGRLGLEPCIRNRLAALDREAVRPVLEAGLGPVDRGQLVIQVGNPAGVELILVEVFGTLVPRLYAGIALERIVATDRERLLDPGPLSRQQLTCTVSIHTGRLLKRALHRHPALTHRAVENVVEDGHDRYRLALPCRFGMGAPAGDPYATLGVARDASDADVRLAYRHLVQLHHPDHNGGSAESARRFEEIQDAYNRIRELREQPAQARPPRPRPPRPEPPRPEPPRPEPPRAAADPARDARLAQMEREVREAHLARERAQRAAREAAADRPERPSDEELGYVKTDDSFSKIFADARSELADLFSDRDKHSLAKRLGDLIDELDPRPRR